MYLCTYLCRYLHTIATYPPLHIPLINCFCIIIIQRQLLSMPKQQRDVRTLSYRCLERTLAVHRRIVPDWQLLHVTMLIYAQFRQTPRLQISNTTTLMMRLNLGDVVMLQLTREEPHYDSQRHNHATRSYQQLQRQLQNRPSVDHQIGRMLRSNTIRILTISTIQWLV